MRLLAAALLCPLWLCACAPAPEPPAPGTDPMTGCFATGPRRSVDFRVDHQGGQYRLSLFRDGQWQPQDEPLHPASAAELARYFPDNGEQIASALLGHNGAFGLFLLVPEATLKSRDRNSDYLALLVIGTGPVYRRHCD